MSHFDHECGPAIDKRQFPRRVGLYPYRQHKGRKLVLGDRTEALVYILSAHASATRVHSSFPVGRVKNARGRYSEVCTGVRSIAMGGGTDVRLVESVPAVRVRYEKRAAFTKHFYPGLSSDRGKQARNALTRRRLAPNIVAHKASLVH
jgi:hypothetical protein